MCASTSRGSVLPLYSRRQATRGVRKPSQSKLRIQTARSPYSGPTRRETSGTHSRGVWRRDDGHTFVLQDVSGTMNSGVRTAERELANERDVRKQ